MNADELRTYLKQRQIAFEEKEIPHGMQFRCRTGEIFGVFTSGKVSCQGKSETELARAVEAWAGSGGALPAPGEPVAPTPIPTLTSGPDPRVFIVYGHDIAARDNLELILRRMNLEPIVLQNLPAAGDTIIEKLERYVGEHGNVGFACCLLTPDDEGHLAGKPEQRKYRARQNVVLELGMVLARLGRRRVAILHKESVELPSDIAGLLYIPFQERVDEIKSHLFRELREAGYSPNPAGL